MAKYSMKKQGKEIGSASTYAEPHTMQGSKVSMQSEQSFKTGAKAMDEFNIALGGLNKGNYKPTKTDGIVTRGNGAATKGIKARGPMA
jgi:hypothetical protein